MNLLLRLKQLEVILAKLYYPFSLHAAKLLGHVGAFQVQVVCQLLAIKRDVEFV